MADPRTAGPSDRRTNHTPLMRSLIANRGKGTVDNFCPFNCADEELSDNGECPHLVGYTNGGAFYEPRVRGRNGLITVCGEKKQPMKRGMVRVQCTTTARVYSPDPDPTLRNPRPRMDAEAAAAAEREAELLRLADEIRNPVMDGVWEGSPYEAPRQKKAGERAGEKAPPAS